ncbi:DUF3515 family protein [Cryptosporangium sp. NPDC051539]|uniref:DUF3515 family protein n=1 Tax=Cryptosporangium sp. NPDC051539 TaxID=3363962 RepID=UPI0037915242
MATATSERSRAAITATLIALPLAVLTGLGWFWWSGGFADEPTATGPVTVDLRAGSEPPTATPRTETVCRALLANLPTTLGNHASRPVSPKTASERAAAWGDPAIVLRCGVGEPATTVGSAGQVLAINGVSWLVTEGNKVTFLRALDLSVAIDVRLPAPYNVGQPQSLVGPLSAPITESVPAAK